MFFFHGSTNDLVLSVLYSFRNIVTPIELGFALVGRTLEGSLARTYPSNTCLYVTPVSRNIARDQSVRNRSLYQDAE